MAKLDRTEDPSDIATHILAILANGEIAALVTVLTPIADSGKKIVLKESGELVGTLGNRELDIGVRTIAQKFLSGRSVADTFEVEISPDMRTRMMFERIEPEPRLVICGAGHVGAALAHLSITVGYNATIVDDRSDLLNRERFPESGLDLVISKDWREAVTMAIGNGRGVYCAVVTRGHNEDELCVEAALAAAPEYLGLIGSRRRTNIVLNRLAEKGIDEHVLREVRGPVGVDIGAVSPEEVAISILAEIIAVRRGGSLGSMSGWRRDSKR